LTPADLDELVRSRRCKGSADLRTFADVANRIPRISGEVLLWLQTALRDETAKWHAAALLSFEHVKARPLAKDLMRAALTELNPSYNRAFVRPLRGAVSWAEAVDMMLAQADAGGPIERGGVGRVSYWLAIEFRDRDAESSQRLACWKLEEFVRASDVVVLRCLIAGMRFDPEGYPESARALLPVALEKARNHPDEYVKKRLEIQLGESKGPFPMLVTR
jgi:hypothetical protein